MPHDTATKPYRVSPNLRGTKSRWVGTVKDDPNKSGATIKHGRTIVLKRGSNDLIDLTAAEAKALGRDVVLASDRDRMVADRAAAAAARKRGPNDWSDLLNQKVGDIAAAINGMDDVEQIQEIAAAEEQGKNRKTIIEAAENRILDLEDTEDDSDDDGDDSA